MVTEKEFFNDGGIRITNSKLSFRADDGSLRTYLIANLDGYGTEVVAPNWNSWIGLHSLFFVLGFLSMNLAKSNFVQTVLFLVVWLVPTVGLWKYGQRPRKKFYLGVTTAAGKENVIFSYDPNDIIEIIKALDEAVRLSSE